ncbi:MAG: MATE family efflux transporter [Clostridia bacterium]|nr:MATE family efflux transporter [Clostridia bacterium]
MLFTRKDLTRILLPLLAEQILAVTVGMFDSMMVSSAGEAAVSGVSLVDSINLLLSNIFAALATGGAVVCSQFLGRKDYSAARTSAKQLYYVVFFVSAAIMAIALLFRTSLLSLIFGKIDADVMGHAKIYFLFTALSYPFLALYNGGAAVFRAMGNSKISLYVSLGMNAVNIVGNAILIYGFQLGAAGAAIATLFSRILGAWVMLALSHNKKNPIYVENLFRYRPDFPLIKNILHIGVPSGMENGMFQFGKLLTQSLVSTFGTAAIAANAVANTLASFEYAAGGAVGLTMITVIGRCVGAGEKEQAKQYVKKLLGVGYAVMLAVALLLTLSAKPIIGVYKLSAESSTLALTLILVHNIFAVTIWPLAFTLPNSFRAASDVRYPMLVSVFSMWVFRVACSYILALGFDLGVLGVWIAMLIDWGFRTILFVIRFVSGRWLTKYKAA